VPGVAGGRRPNRNASRRPGGRATGHETRAASRQDGPDTPAPSGNSARSPRLAVGEALLAGRYRLEELLSDQGGSSVWKATDESLIRTVTIRTFAPEFGRAGEAVAAARSAAQLSDPRLVQIFDADDRGDQPYIVTEWPGGERLDGVIATGPLEPVRAAEIITEAAEGLTAAHAAGLAHLCLTPDMLWWNRWGEVKISGLGTAAVLASAEADNPAAADTRGLASLLYAALTGYWPGPEETRLPAAPRTGGRPDSPAHVRRGISSHLDAVTCRALFGDANSYGPPILSPAGLAVALTPIAHPGDNTEPLSSLADQTRPFAPVPPLTRPFSAIPAGARPPAAPPSAPPLASGSPAMADRGPAAAAERTAERHVPPSVLRWPSPTPAETAAPPPPAAPAATAGPAAEAPAPLPPAARPATTGLAAEAPAPPGPAAPAAPTPPAPALGRPADSSPPTLAWVPAAPAMPPAVPPAPVTPPATESSAPRTPPPADASAPVAAPAPGASTSITPRAPAPAPGAFTSITPRAPAPAPGASTSITPRASAPSLAARSAAWSRAARSGLAQRRASLPQLPPLPARAATPVRAALAILLLVVSVLAGWLLGHHGTSPHSAAPVTGPSAAVPHSRVLRPVSATGFDPYGSGQNAQFARLAIDGSPATAWHTEWYTTAKFGNLKPGTGLLIDMGRLATITGARITLGSSAGADFQLRVGSSASLARLRTVAHADGAGGQVNLRLTAPARGRYVLIWFTQLPPDRSGTFEASVYNVRLEGRR
jgi:hypothetical protein